MNVTFNSSVFAPSCFQIIVLAKIGTETFTIGKLTFESTEQWKESKSKLLRDALHPSDELVEVLKNKFKQYNNFFKEEDYRNAYIEFIFVDSCPEIVF